MDGYTFMIERNRRLIEHEARLAEGPGRWMTPEEMGEQHRAAATDIRKLYTELEGCGRAAAADRDGSH